MYTKIKCRNCRTVIFNKEECNCLLVNSHEEPLQPQNPCEDENLVYLSQVELPFWILNKIEEGYWSKGRINCRNCDNRIGAFDYISGLKCNCSNYVVPPVHLIKSKVDLIK